MLRQLLRHAKLFRPTVRCVHNIGASPTDAAPKLEEEFNSYYGRDGYEGIKLAKFKKKRELSKKERNSRKRSGVPVVTEQKASKMVIGGKPLKNKDLIYGNEPVYAALRVKKRETFRSLYVLVTEEKQFTGQRQKWYPKGKLQEKIRSFADALKIPIKPVPRATLDQLSKFRPHNGVVLEAGPLPVYQVDAALDVKPFLDAQKAGKAMKPPLYVALDQLTDPQNVGAILRSCLYFGVDGVIMSRTNTSPITSTVLKASSGAAEHLHLLSCRDMTKFLWKTNNFNIIAMTLDEKARSCESIKFEKPTILLLGSEGFGISEETMKACHKKMKILSHSNPEIEHNVDSLNVSSSLAIALYQLTSCYKK